MNITRIRRVALSCALLPALLAIGCEKVPLLAPSGSTITLTASTTALSVNGTTQLIAQVLEPAGTPPHSGTHIIFSTTLGTIEPSEVETDVSGRAVVTFKAGNANGTATISASSGGASAAGTNAVRIAVGTAAVGRVVMNANPTLISALGGTSVISATVQDINGNPLTAAPVSFSTTAGTLDTSGGITDGSGVATVTLRTSTQATVTASVGAQGGSTTGGGGGTGNGGGTPGTPGTPTTPTPGTGTGTATGQASGSITVNVAGAPQLVITPPTTPPSAGLPSSYTFAVTAATANASPIRNVTVNWGDGVTQDLGAVTGNAVVAHTYPTAGAFTITATVTDSFGTVVPVSTGVTVVATASSTINITPSVPTGSKVATFTIQVTPPTGVGIQSSRINFGDGVTQDLGGLNGTTTVIHEYATSGTRTVTLTVVDTLGRTSTGSNTVNIP